MPKESCEGSKPGMLGGGVPRPPTTDLATLGLRPPLAEVKPMTYTQRHAV